MPLSRHRNLKPDAMPAFTMFCDAFCTKNQTTATIAAVAAPCQRMSRTLRSRRSAIIWDRGPPGPPHEMSGPGGPRSQTSLERRREEQAALGPELVLAALQLERRAHADGA